MEKHEKGAVLKKCRRCMVYSSKGQRLSEARVTHTKEEITLFFADKQLADGRLKTRVDFFDDRRGLIMTMSDLVIHRNPSFPQEPERWAATCTILDVKQVVQRQKDIRVDVDIDTAFRRVDGMDTFLGTIRNISAGGIYLLTRQKLQKGERITFSYDFRTLVRPFELEIVRVGRGEGIYNGYGCRFIGLTDGGDAAIRGFVYKKQQEKNTEAQ